MTTITVVTEEGCRIVKTERCLAIVKVTVAEYMAYHIRKGAHIELFDVESGDIILAY